MKSIFIYCLLLTPCTLNVGCAYSGGAADQEQPGASTKQSVYFGNYYGSGSHPGIADNMTCGPHSAIGMLSTPNFSCSGVLVRNNIVVTAHHCQPVANVTTFSFPGTINADTFTVTHVAYAPDYEGSLDSSSFPNGEPGPNDIAVLTLDRAVPRHVAQPLWLLVDPPATYPGLSLMPYDNPPDFPPELVGYGGTQSYNSGAGSGTRRYVPVIGLQWASNTCNLLSSKYCWADPFWQSADDLNSSQNYEAPGDSGER